MPRFYDDRVKRNSAREDSRGRAKVTCGDIDRLLISNALGAATPPEAAAHLAACERCRLLAGAIGQTPEVAPPSPEQVNRIETGILAGLKPVKPLPGALWLAFLFVIAAVVAVGGFALGAAGWHALSVPQRITVFTALAAAAGLLAFSAGRQVVPGSRLWPAPYLLVIAVLGAISGICAVLFLPRPESTFVATGLVCLKIGLECAIPAALLLWLLLRRGAILSPMPAGATVGALAGLSGLTVLEIFCPNLNRYHILAWHLGSVLASVAGAVAIGTIAEYSGAKRLRRSQ